MKFSNIDYENPKPLSEILSHKLVEPEHSVLLVHTIGLLSQEFPVEKPEFADSNRVASALLGVHNITGILLKTLRHVLVDVYTPNSDIPNSFVPSKPLETSQEKFAEIGVIALSLLLTNHQASRILLHTLVKRDVTIPEKDCACLRNMFAALQQYVPELSQVEIDPQKPVN